MIERDDRTARHHFRCFQTKFCGGIIVEVQSKSSKGWKQRTYHLAGFYKAEIENGVRAIINELSQDWKPEENTEDIVAFAKEALQEPGDAFRVNGRDYDFRPYECFICLG